MLSFPFLALVVNTILIFSIYPSSVYGHSAPPRPLKRIDHPSTLSIDILPRTRPDVLAGSALASRRSTVPEQRELLPTDSFRLTLSAFGDSFHLHLAPNDLLLHPQATVSHFRPGPDGRAVLYATRPLAEHMRKTGVRAYAGEVVASAHSARRMREDTAGVLRSSQAAPLTRGWARIIVHSTGNAEKGIAPSFEGAFSADGVVHHVATRDAYARRKHVRDPAIVPGADPLDSGLVVWREVDVMSELEARDLTAEGEKEAAHTCAHDALPFNTNSFANNAIRRRVAKDEDEEDGPWYDPLGLFGDSAARNETIPYLFARADGDVQTGDGQMSDNFGDVIGNTAGCPKEQRIVYTGVAADCTYTRRYGSVENATTQILNNWNSASDLFKRSFNVSLGIIDLQMHDPECPKTADPATPWNIDCGGKTLNDRLSLFSEWRGKKGDDGAGLWHLLSNCPTGTEVGIAWLGTLCQQTSFESSGSIVSGTAVSTAGRTEWQVIAHETGHNFGAIHDCADDCKSGDMCCPLSGSQCSASAGFIMSPVATDSEQKFSLCSLGNVCSLMTGAVTGGGGFTNQTCLIDPKLNLRKVISLSQCGNGIVEDGEDCDPGPNGNSTCCDKKTCKFLAGAVCDPASSACCTGQCQFAPATTTCRPSKDAFCDEPEMCTGNSSSCPKDVFKPNGQSCGSDGLSCASGICTSLNKQCQQLGSSLNLQRACPQTDTSCRVSCQDPKASNQCITLQTALVDGSPCGYGGTCNAGRCNTGPLLDQAKSWFIENKHISIPVAVVAGILVLMFLWGIMRAIIRCCSSPRRQPEPVLQARIQGPPPSFRPTSGPRPPPYAQQQQPLQRANSTNVRTGVASAAPIVTMPAYQPPSQHFAYQQREPNPSGSWEEFPRAPSPPVKPPGALPNPWAPRQ